MAASLEAKQHLRTMNIFHRVLYRRKLSRVTVFLLSLSFPTCVLAMIHGDELPLQKHIKKMVNAAKRWIYRQKLEAQPTAKSMIAYTDSLGDIFRDSYDNGFYDVDSFVAAVEANRELVEKYAFADVRTSLAALKHVGELLKFMQEKNVTVLVKDKRVQQAYLNFIITIKTTAEQDFETRANRLLQSLSGQKDASLRNYWVEYGYYLSTIYVLMVLVLGYGTADSYTLLESVKKISMLVTAVCSSLPESITAPFLAQLSSLFKSDKQLFEADYVYYLNQALMNSELAVKILNNRYIFGVVKALAPGSGHQHLKLVKDFLRQVIKVLKDPQVKSTLNWSQVEKDTKLTIDEVKGKDTELDKLLSELLKLAQKK